jgi:hypothetical protein
MKMLLVIFRRSLDHEMRRFLKGLDLKALTEAPKFFGIGDAGQACDAFHLPGFHSMILAGIDEDQTERVLEELKGFRDHQAALQHGAKVPMRVFILPCERVM